MILPKFHLKYSLNNQCLKMLLVIAIFAFILAANSLDCVWLKNQQGAGKLTSLMDSSSGTAQFHFNKENPQAKYIEIHLSDSLDASSNNMTMILNIENRVVEESGWINSDNLYLNVFFSSSNITKTANQTKYLSYGLKANISYNSKAMLAVYTSEGSFIFKFGLSTDQTTQNPSDALSSKPVNMKQGKFGSYLLQSQQRNLLYLLISVLIMASDIIYLQYFYIKPKASFRLSRTASTLYLFSQAIYFIGIIEVPQKRVQSFLIMIIIVFTVMGKCVISAMKLDNVREIIEDAIIMVISLTFSYPLYFLVLVYCIIRDTQTSAQMKYTSDQRWLSHCRTLFVILYLPAFKLIYNIPTGFPVDSAIFWWSYFFMLIYLSSICEINYRVGVKTCIHNAKQILSAKLLAYYNILKKGEVNSGKIDKMAEEVSQLDKIGDQQRKKEQMKQKSK